MLKIGSEGDEVKGLQTALLRKGINVGAVDGIFGAKTADGLKRWQEREGLAADGIAGPNTLSSLGLGEEEEDSSTPPSMY